MDLQSNEQLELACEYVFQTNKNIFLTGKAGTGKTTFLHRIRQDSVKRMVVVAPTGVAAINAGGMTIHSFFQLPFGPYVPGKEREVARQRKFSGEKIRLIKSLDLLVIDEVSMVRADLLDGIDAVLRRFRNPYQAFGGVQLLLIGDLHQLPPVATDEEWRLLRDYYPTPYFFSSRALQQAPPVVITLTHIFRQSDSAFIDLLNRVRDNALDPEVLDMINSRYVAGFRPDETEGYITLTTHNASARELNAEKLAAIPGSAQRFEAGITGDFPPQSYPTDQILELKPGAQVMFVKNDTTLEKRFFNGKIGQISAIRTGEILVKCPGEAEPVRVAPMEWENIQYALNEQNREIAETVVGIFRQYPLRLAWAITIHKSQGLTFERMILDAQAAFAHGQVYVALSRCKSFEGLVLCSRIAYSSVRTDATVRDYSAAADKNAPDAAQLQASKKAFQQTLILDLFDFHTLQNHFEQLRRVMLEHENALLPEAFGQLQALERQVALEIYPVADKFRPQLLGYFEQDGLPEANEALQERLRKAAAWFAEKLGVVFLPAAKNIEIITDNKTAHKSAFDALAKLQLEIFVKNACFSAAQTGFSSQAYLRAKAHAELDFQAAPGAVRQAAGPSANIPSGVAHPELFAQLAQWRRNFAELQGLDAYQVLHTKTLVEIVRTLPSNLKALRKIKGIGEGKSRQFGAELVGMILQYCVENGISTDPPDLYGPEIEGRSQTDTKALTLALYKSGKTIDEIAAERGLARSTIEGHLAHFVGLLDLDIFELIPKEDVRAIEDFFVENNTDQLSAAKAHFGETYSYGQIKMVLLWMFAKGRLKAGSDDLFDDF